MSYKSASGSLSVTNLPNAEEKQIPKSLPGNYSHVSKADTPAIATAGLRADHVFIHTSGSYNFSYDGTNYEAAIKVTPGDGMGNLPLRLDINPLMWSGSAVAGTGTLATGDVTFVYRGSK